MDTKETSEEERKIVNADIKQEPVDSGPSDGSTDTMDESITKIEEILVMKKVPTEPEIKLLNIIKDNNLEHTISSDIKQEPTADLELMKGVGSGEKTLQRLPAYTHSDIKQEPMGVDQTDPDDVKIQLISEGSEQHETDDIKYVNTQDFLDISETVISKQDRAMSEQDRATPGTSSKGDVRLKTKSSKNKETRLLAGRKQFECDNCGCQTSKCEICDDQYRKPDNLKQHLRTHTVEKPYKCEVCDYRSGDKGHIKRHIRTHTGEKPYKCEVCDYRSGDKGNLKRHIRIHTEEKPYTGEKPYKCEVCDYRSGDKGHIKRHIRTHTGEKPYKCEICDYKFRHLYTLKLHVRTHTGEKPYKCKICDYKFRHQSSLKRHIDYKCGNQSQIKPYT